MPVHTDELARQIQETNARLSEAIETIHSEGLALRDELSNLRTDLGKINTSLAWMKGISGFVGISVVGIGMMVFQAGERSGRMAQAIATLQKTTDELRTDVRTRDKGVELSRIQTTLDRLAETVSHFSPPSHPR